MDEVLTGIDEAALETLDSAALDVGLLLTVLELLLFDELGAELEVVAGGTEHSLMPPATVLPVPNVASLQIKLPFTIL